MVNYYLTILVFGQSPLNNCQKHYVITILSIDGVRVLWEEIAYKLKIERII